VTDAFNATTKQPGQGFFDCEWSIQYNAYLHLVGHLHLPGSTPTVSANGATNGIVWTLDRTSNTLNAYDATNLANELYTRHWSEWSRHTWPDRLIHNADGGKWARCSSHRDRSRSLWVAKSANRTLCAYGADGDGEFHSQITFMDRYRK